ncbi:MAG: secondary thiamine-phosphate synthase enzyme YjbQ, partial [bacterium]|nr:secondary thiamine-phosphate synthase enzyme YjbQ [bacterium]
DVLQKACYPKSMRELLIHTKKEREIKDITSDIQEVVKEQGMQEGLCSLFLTHTSAALTTADLDRGTDLDMLDAFEAMVPKLNFRHPHNPEHVKDHIVASLIGPSLAVPVEKGELLLGPWQKIVLVELGGPRERTIAITFS